MSYKNEFLSEVKKDLDDGRDAERITVRQFLDRFGFQRRSYWNVWFIRKQLNELGLETVPDFQAAFIDSPIAFRNMQGIQADDETEIQIDLAEPTKGEIRAAIQNDPTYRISKLAAANRTPKCVNPDTALAEAITIMMANDYSQLPVSTTEREIKGVVSWASIGCRIVLGNKVEYVRDAMEAHHEIKSNLSMFDAIPTITRHGYVLIRDMDNRLSGIVTASDLSEQFLSLSEPFLLLGEIENHLRGLLDNKFDADELREVRDPSDGDRTIEGISDLTFGEYLRLLENEDRWRKIGLRLDRKTFCSDLNDVRKIRNDVMHFDPDGVPSSDLIRLRDFALFLQKLRAIGKF